MRFFDATPEGAWGSKYNFVDENNVFVGFDSNFSCCEHFGWFISDEPMDDYPEEAENELEDWSPWRFDPDFFEEKDGFNREYSEEGGIAIFRLVNTNTEEVKYLHLFNDHNGYYSHGFSMEINGTTKHEGTL